MTSMIERVARAMAELDRPVSAYSPERWWEIRGKDFTEKARAAIEAMREPTDELHGAAEEISVYYDDFSCGDGNITLGLPGYRAKFNGVWSSLIDAALVTTPKE